MRSNYLKATMKTAVLAVTILLLSVGIASAQSVALTANRQTTTLPDGQIVPMWGWTCGAPVAGSTATCTALNGLAQSGTTWQPPLITVPTGTLNFSITLKNTLPVNTSLVIVGQLGTGSGTTGVGNPKRETNPRTHAPETQTTWPIATPLTFTPPAQGQRARSFAQEATPNGGSQTYTWASLRPGTYLIETGTYPSIQAPMGLYGVLVVTQSPVGATAGVAYSVTTTSGTLPAVSYDADVPVELSEIDPVQNAAVEKVAEASASCPVNTGTCTGTISEAVETTKWNPTCAAAGGCYPAAVNFTPLYYLVNGVSFSKDAPLTSALTVPLTATATTGNVLLRFVNAGLRMHVPSVVGLNMSLVAEDGNLHPDVALAVTKGLPAKPKVQNEEFMAAGKVLDVVVNPTKGAVAVGVAGTYASGTYAVFDRSLGVSTNNQRDGGMQAYLVVNGGSTSAGFTGGVPSAAMAVANPDNYYCTPGVSLTVSDPGKGVIANDLYVYGVTLTGNPANRTVPVGGGTVTLNADGTFTYTQLAASSSCAGSFTYYANGNIAITATVTLAPCTGTCLGGAPTANPDSYTSSVASMLKVNQPGVLGNDVDPAGHPLTAVLESAGNCTGLTLNPDGSFVVTGVTAGRCSFTYHAVNSQKTPSNSTTATLTFPSGSGLLVSVLDAQSPTTVITDYSWVIEEDTNFHSKPGVSTPPPAQTLATSFHKSFMPLVASGCTGPVSCGTGQTVYNPVTNTHVPVPPDPQITPDQVVLDPNKFYYISVLPGDAANPFNTGNTVPGHTMGGSPIPSPAASSLTAFAPVTVLAEPNPVPPAQLGIFVFEDNNPTNGSVDGVEEQQGLGGFQIILNDVAGATGDPTGQMTYDMFNMPLTNALNGRIDTATGLNMCPISPTSTDASGNILNAVGVIITCPALESDGKTPSPVAGQALIKNLFPNRFDVFAKPGAEREARGEQWLQTSTLEGTHANDAFAKLGEPSYFQEFGPPGFHGFIGFVNPGHIQAAQKAVCKATVANATPCPNTVTGKVTNLHMSRPWNQTLYDSNSHVPLDQSVCYVGANSQNGVGANVGFARCDPDGHFTLTGLPDGQYEIVVWDQWLDQIIEYQSYTFPLAGATTTAGVTTSNIGDVPVFSWFNKHYSNTYMDLNQNGVQDPGEPGLVQIPYRIRYRSGQISNVLGTDAAGSAVFSELFPLFNWYVVESDTTRFKGTGVHIANNAGGSVDTAPPYAGVLNSTETFSLPGNRQVPGAKYTPGKTTRIDPGTTLSEGFQSFISQPQYMDWGKTPYLPGENGGLLGHVIYASTRPFDDPNLGFQNTWEPLVPRVTVNLYQEITTADGTQSLSLIDTTKTSSWDDWATGVNPATGIPYMNCPGQDTADPYYTYTLGPANQYKCYDGFHNWNQVEPAPYDGQYQFPSANCKAGALATATTPAAPGCVPNPNPAPSNPLVTHVANILPAGKYVVEVVVPPGYEIVKEEDKNILIGDSYVAPVTTQFGAMVNIFIMPDQASVDAYNLNNPNNATANLGRTNFANFGPGGVGIFSTPCVGSPHIVPDYMSIYPGSLEVAPFAGATKPLCDRREVTLEDQMQSGAEFLIFTKTPIASHFTGIILDDASSEFNTAAPDFGEKFAVPFVPVSFRDFNGVEVARVYSDQFGTFNGLVYSTWEVNPPNPTGYAPNMMITCMNDPGPIPDPAHPGRMITDPMFNPNYSNFCYTWPFMPGTTSYMDTPVLPTAAFASGYNPVDCAYPDATPAILRVDGDGQFGPWVSAAGAKLTITALGDVQVPNNAYGGPFSTTAPFNLKNITRHYGFGSTQGNNQGNSQCPGTATLNGAALTINSWSDTSITATVPDGATTGELVITACNGMKSVDTVTVTIGGKQPIYVNPPSQTTATPNGLLHPIQDAIDAAQPGDLIMLNGAINPATPTTICGSVPSAGCLAGAANYPELVIMWKPVRLQGVGAASVVINAAKYPTQKLEQWRTKINGLFGLDLQGNAIPGVVPRADILPGQEITGGIIGLEPSVLSTEEGAGITVTARNIPASQCTMAGVDNTSNYNCYPSRIDGIGITGSDAGGAIYVNGWAHNLEISNGRFYGNAGVFTGGVRIGQPYLLGLAGAGPFNFDTNVKIHHNSITQNGSLESNLGQGAAGAGLSMCSGSDNYLVNYNWVCGNFSLGDGGGIGHIGLSWKGTIANNWILWNQSFNQSSNTEGGGLAIEGETGTATALSLGTGDVIVDSNLILGNHAAGGHGGGVRLQDVNGDDVARNPDLPGYWWVVSLTNNMIVDNVAGYAGGGISLDNTVFSQIINNTIANNDSTATVGSVVRRNPMTSAPQPAGISSELHSPALVSAFGPSVPASLKKFSNPMLENDIIWHNRSFSFSVTSPAGSGANPGVPATVTLVPTLIQTSIGQCPSGAQYWDLGIVGDTSPTNGANGRMNPTFSMLTSTSGGYGTAAAHNINGSNPGFVKEYCNGSRVTPGIIDGTPPTPAFMMAPAVTEDEGGNFIDVRYGPLSLSNSSLITTAGTVRTPLADYRIGLNSPAVDTANSQLAPNHDFFGTPRPQGPDFDRGAHEVVKTGAPAEGEITVWPTLVGFGSVQIGTVGTLTTTITNNGTANLAYTVGPLTGANANQFTRSNNCGGNLAAGASCTITLTFHPTNSAAGVGPKTASFNVTETDPNNPLNVPITVTLTGEGQRPSGTVLPTPLAFGSQLVNTITVTAAQPVTVTNTGVGPLFITSIVINGTNANQFTQTNVNCPIGGLGIPVGGTCTINVNFRPTSLTPANKFANLAVRFTNPLTLPSQVQNVSLTGTATAVAVTQAPLAFGTAPPADTTLTAQVNNNAASGNLTITSVTITAGGAYFTIAAGTTCTPGAIVAATNSCDVNVTFTRTPANSTAIRTGNLRIVTPSGTFNVPLSGN